MIEGSISMGYDYRTSKYKRERDALKEELESTTKELDELKNALLKILNNANSSSDTYELSYDDFKYYFLAATSSEEDFIRDQFDTLFVTSVMFFGQDLQEIKTEKIDVDFEKKHLPKIQKFLRQPSVSATGEGIKLLYNFVLKL